MTFARRPRHRWPLGFALLAATAWACIDATDVELLQIGGSGLLLGRAFIDYDGDGAISNGDDLMVGAEVALVTSRTGDRVAFTTTDAGGAFRLRDVPVGSYRLAFDSTVLGDSLVMAAGGREITVVDGDSTEINVGATYDEVSIAEALLLPPGRRVFTSGIALNQRLNFGDGQVHFRGGGSFLRGLDVDRGTLLAGDSAKILGRVVIDNGRPAFTRVSFAVLIQNAVVPTPTDVSTGRAVTADAGALDAALARIRFAEIIDTATTPEGHFRVWADDGSDSVEVVIRDFLVPTVNTSLFRPDTIVRIQQAIGLLSPYDPGTGSVRWRVLPRSASDIVLENKLADLAVTTSFDVGQASLGDTVEITVGVTNLGPLPANTIQVRDTIPTGLAFVSATATTGGYDSGTGRWNIGSLAVSGAGTLRILVEVTTAGPANVTNIVQSLGSLLEVDPVAGNNQASVVLGIS